MECGGYAAGAEPGGDVADCGAVGVVEVMPGGEEFDGCRARFVQRVEQTGVKALLEEDVGGDGGLHHFLRYSRGGCRVRSTRIGTLWEEAKDENSGAGGLFFGVYHVDE